MRNVSTRLTVLTGENVLIAGFKVDTTQQVLQWARANADQLWRHRSTGRSDDRVVRLSGAIITLSNDNWKDTNIVAIAATGKAPPMTRSPPSWPHSHPAATLRLCRARITTGVGLVEAYGIVPAPFVNLISNISSRGLVGTGNNVMIGGFIVDGGPSLQVIVRALGPTLTSNLAFSMRWQTRLLNYAMATGTSSRFNDDWQDRATEPKTLIQMLGLAPPNSNQE